MLMEKRVMQIRWNLTITLTPGPYHYAHPGPYYYAHPRTLLLRSPRDLTITLTPGPYYYAHPGTLLLRSPRSLAKMTLMERQPYYGDYSFSLWEIIWDWERVTVMERWPYQRGDRKLKFHCTGMHISMIQNTHNITQNICVHEYTKA